MNSPFTEKGPFLVKKVCFLRKRFASLVYSYVAYNRSLFTMYLVVISHVHCLRSITRNSVRLPRTMGKGVALQEFYIPFSRHVVTDCIVKCIPQIQCHTGRKWNAFVLKHLTICFFIYTGEHSMSSNYNCFAGHVRTGTSLDSDHSYNVVTARVCLGDSCQRPSSRYYPILS